MVKISSQLNTMPHARKYDNITTREAFNLTDSEIRVQVRDKHKD